MPAGRWSSLRSRGGRRARIAAFAEGAADYHPPMTTTETDLIGDALVHLPDIAAIRRRIHRHPEQGLHLPETQETIVEELRRFGLEARIGTNLSSVTAVIGADRQGRTIVLRGHMDALRLHEDTGFRSHAEDR